MQRGTNAKCKIIALLEGRPEEFLQTIRQFVLDRDERDYIDFLYPTDPTFAGELEERAAEAKAMLENLRDIDGTLRDLGQRQDQNLVTCLTPLTPWIRRRALTSSFSKSTPATFGRLWTVKGPSAMIALKRCQLE